MNTFYKPVSNTNLKSVIPSETCTRHEKYVLSQVALIEFKNTNMKINTTDFQSQISSV